MSVFYTNNFWYAVVLFIMLSGVSYFFHNDTLKNFPQHMHAWSQTDHYAMILGFINNDLDILHPETYNLMPNLENPSEMETSITASDFPILEFASAGIMKVFHLRSPLTYRIISIICSVIALIFIYLISWQLNIPALVGFMITLIIACSPIYIYYQAAILPSIPGFMFAAGATFFYLNYIKKNNRYDLLLAVLLIATASLIRKPLFIFFAALLIHNIYLLILKKKNLKALPTWLLGVIIIITHQLYQSYLASKYGSTFLDSFMPAESINEFIQLNKRIFNNWQYHFYNHGVKYLLIASCTWFFLQLFYQNLNTLQLNLLLLIILFFAAALLFYIVLQKQFVNHDYYIIDVFLLPFVLSLLLFISHIKLQVSWKENSFVLLLSIIFFWSISDARAMHEHRMKIYDSDYYDAERVNFEGSESYLNSIGISKDARILCLNASTTNTPLILMNRKGYTIYKNRRPYIESSLKWPYEVIVMQNQFTLSHTFAVYPELLNHVQRKKSNGKISVFTNTLNDSADVNSVFKIEKVKSLVCDNADSINIIPSEWFKHMNKDSTFYFSKPYSSQISADKKFPALIEITSDELLTTKSFLEIKWNSKIFFTDLHKPVHLVFLKEFNDSSFAKIQYELTDIVKATNQWQDVQVLCPITDINQLKNVKIYLSNSFENSFWIDDTESGIYENRFE